MKNKIIIYDIERLGEFVETLVCSGYSVNVKPMRKSSKYEHWIDYEVEYEQEQKNGNE